LCAAIVLCGVGGLNR